VLVLLVVAVWDPLKSVKFHFLLKEVQMNLSHAPPQSCNVAMILFDVTMQQSVNSFWTFLHHVGSMMKHRGRKRSADEMKQEDFVMN